MDLLDQGRARARDSDCDARTAPVAGHRQGCSQATSSLIPKSHAPYVDTPSSTASRISAPAPALTHVHGHRHAYAQQALPTAHRMAVSRPGRTHVQAAHPRAKGPRSRGARRPSATRWATAASRSPRCTWGAKRVRQHGQPAPTRSGRGPGAAMRTLSLTEAAAFLCLHPEELRCRAKPAHSRREDRSVPGFSSTTILLSMSAPSILSLGKRCK